MVDENSSRANCSEFTEVDNVDSDENASVLMLSAVSAITADSVSDSDIGDISSDSDRETSRLAISELSTGREGSSSESATANSTPHSSQYRAFD
jgi:hypothetical protein